MDKLYWLEQIQKTVVHQSNDSADSLIWDEQVLSLAKIAQQGYPVLPAFVLSAELWHEFVEPLIGKNNLVADLPQSSLHVDVNNWRKLQQLANRLCDEINNATIPESWIDGIEESTQQWHCRCVMLRPILILPEPSPDLSAVASLFNILECLCRKDAIAKTLKQVWSQVFQATSLVYWQQVGIDLRDVGIAVLVQPLYDIVASGTLAVKPQVWEVQSTWGWGLTMTRGDVIPDLDKIYFQQGRTIKRTLGHKSVADWVLTSEEKIDTYQQIAIAPISNDSCVVTAIVEDNQQKQFALSSTQLEELIAIAQNLDKDLHCSFTLEWVITTADSSQSLLLSNITVFPTSKKHNRDQPDTVALGDRIYGTAAARGKVRGTAYVIPNLEDKPESLPPQSIFVAPSIAAEWLPLLTNSVGIITEQGGLTSHAAILARELNIPAVVRVANATQIFHTGDRLVIDGDKGEVFSDRNVNFSLNKTEPEAKTRDIDRADVDMDRDFHHRTNRSFPLQTPIATQLFVNLSQTQSVENIQAYPVDGIGLLRSELMGIPLLEGQNLETWLHPNHKRSLLIERWSQCVSQFTRAFAPRPVFYRAYDGRYQSLQSSQKIGSESHHILGRGTLNYMQNPELLDFELQALAQVLLMGQTNFNLILPFVRTVEEFTYCRERVIAAGLTQNPAFQLWIMAEVPSVLFLLPEYVKAGVQGIAIGTNDLTQLLFAIDRETSNVSIDARHAALLAAVEHLITTAKTVGIPCSICGHAPSQYPDIIEDLVRWGITAISVEASAVERTYNAIAKAEQKIILAAARDRLNARRQKK